MHSLRSSIWFGALLSALFIPGATGESTRDAALDLGIRQVKDGDYETAVFTLDGVVRRLSGQPAKKSDLVTAYVHLGVAYLGLEHEPAAKGKFREAAKLDPQLQLSPDEFSPRAIRLFKSERLKLTAAKKKHTARWLTAAGVGGAGAAVAVAALAGGGTKIPDNRPPLPTVTVSPEGQMIVGITVVTLTASATDPEGDPVTYTWDLGDGTSASGETVRHVYDKEGLFQSKLTATDSKSSSGTSGATITVRSLTGMWKTANSYSCTQSGTAFNCDLVATASQSQPPPWYRFVVSDPRRIDGTLIWGTCVGEVRSDLDSLWCTGTGANTEMNRLK